LGSSLEALEVQVPSFIANTLYPLSSLQQKSGSVTRYQICPRPISANAANFSSSCHAESAFGLSGRPAVFFLRPLLAIVLKKSFLGDERNFKGPLIHFAGGDVGGPALFTKKAPPTFVSALRSFAAAATAKNQLSRDFRCRSIFDFFNTIGT
jgi:hypothetical protein